MKRFFSRFGQRAIGRKNRPKRTAPRNNRRWRTSFETLERIDLMAADILFDAASGVLTLQGTEGADVAAVSYDNHGTPQFNDDEYVFSINGEEMRFGCNLGISQVKQVTFHGLGGDDQFTNTTALKSLAYGGFGNDTLRGGSGSDTMYGGYGHDLLLGDGSLGYGQTDFLYGDNEPGMRPVLLAVDGNDTIGGGHGNDVIEGQGGNDLLYGNYGHDTLKGGDGHDTLYGGLGNDDLFGGFGNDTLYGEAGMDELFGNAGHDLLSGGDDADWLYGHTGEDTLWGGNGDDWLFGDEHNDWLYGGAGRDVLFGGHGHDQMSGGDGDDWLYGGEGDDELAGDYGNDRLYGDAGRDFLDGGAHNDTLYGGDNNDTLRGNQGDDWLYGESGDDLLRGGSGKDRLFGGYGNDGLFGGGTSDPDVLDGGQGADRLLIQNGDSTPGAMPEDAVIGFYNGGPVDSDGDSFAAGYWTDAEIEMIDQAFAILHDRTHNTRLLKRANGGNMTFTRIGSAAELPEHPGWNQGSGDITISSHVFDYGGGGINKLMRVIFHEIGHNWDTADTNPTVGEFRALSGWIGAPTNATLGAPYTRSEETDPGWWYLDSAQFVSDYATTNPREDFAESFESYMMSWWKGGGWGADSIPAKIDYMEGFVDSLTT